VPPKAELDAAVDARFEAMLAAGALDEVAALERLGLDPGLPAMKALGVPALRRVVQGDCDLVQAAAEVKRATRRYAKRQRTWLRHQMDGGHSIAAQYSESLRPEIFSFIRQFLLTDPP
jgi:tRNA dimethylallyltransferase